MTNHCEVAFEKGLHLMKNETKWENTVQLNNRRINKVRIHASLMIPPPPLEVKNKQKTQELNKGKSTEHKRKTKNIMQRV